MFLMFQNTINKGLFNIQVINKYIKPPIMVEILETSKTTKNIILGRKFFEFSIFQKKVVKFIFKYLPIYYLSTISLCSAAVLLTEYKT